LMYGTVNGITAWVETKNSAKQAAAASLAETKVSGNRGTGLSPGTWTWDGGMMWNGVNLNPSFKLDVRIKEVSDNTFTADALDSSYINGETLPPGGYKDVTGTYARVQTGLWTVRRGYHLKKRMCTTAGTCMNELLIREGQSKMLMYGTVNGITAWVETKNSAKQAAAALAETKEDSTSAGKYRTRCSTAALLVRRNGTNNAWCNILLTSCEYAAVCGRDAVNVTAGIEKCKEDGFQALEIAGETADANMAETADAIMAEEVTEDSTSAREYRYCTTHARMVLKNGPKWAWCKVLLTGCEWQRTCGQDPVSVKAAYEKCKQEGTPAPEIAGETADANMAEIADAIS